MRIISIGIVLLFFYVNVDAQNESKWQEEINKLTSKEIAKVKNSKGLILLTGSSSARFWSNFNEVFPKYTTVNNGFGGSQMHELLYYIDDLIINYEPDIVLIYEGDNDISAGKTKDEILETTMKVVDRLKSHLPKTKIYFISPKPSIARWKLKDQYVAFNRALKAYTADLENVFYLDVWSPMLDENGEPMTDIFISDGLHMNEKGYEIWEKVVQNEVRH